ncbi:hypothetical protein GLU60_01245 [Nanohaloarchaea archaeon H01]|nr:hypothetical protein [Nanohaloarchaea archaeon H01]
MEFEGLKTLLEGSDQALIDEILPEIFLDHYSGNLEADLEYINSSLSDEDIVTEVYKGEDIPKFMLRATEIEEVPGDEEIYFASTLEGEYTVRIPVNVEESEFCLVKMDSHSKQVIHGVSRLEPIALIDYEELERPKNFFHS